MVKIFNQKFNLKKKNLFFLTGALIIVVISLGLIVFSLTFLIKNINFVLRPLPEQNSAIHFNTSEAERLFLQDK